MPIGLCDDNRCFAEVSRKRAFGSRTTAPNQALEPTPTAFARPSLRLLARLTASVRLRQQPTSVP